MLRKSLFSLLMFMLPIGVMASSHDYVVIKNLKWEWLKFDQTNKKHVPYLNNEAVSSISFRLELVKYQDFNLLLELPQNYSLWINQQLILTTDHNTHYELSIDSLYAHYQSSAIDLSLFHPNFNSKAVICAVINPSTSNLLNQGGIDIAFRTNMGRMNVFILGSLMVLGLMVILRSLNYRLFIEYFSLTKALSVRQQFEMLTSMSLMSGVNLLVMIFYSLIVGVTMLNFTIFLSEEQRMSFPLLEGDSSLWFGFKIGSFALISIILRMPFLSLMTQMFQLHKIKNFHFYAYFRLSLLIIVFLFLVSILNGTLGGGILDSGLNYIQICMTLLLAARVLLLFFALNRIHGYRKLHLFAYLCSTELIPLILFSKVFLK